MPNSDMIRLIMTLSQFPIMSVNQFEEFILSTAPKTAESIENETIYAPELDDLYSLYTKVRNNKIVAVIEFGSGWSTLALAKALDENRLSFSQYVKKNIRHPNPFRVLTIDASQHFQGLALERLEPQLLEIVSPVVADVTYGTFLGRICTYFEYLPAFTADFIYLDGPDCDQIQGNFHGFDLNFGTSQHKYGLPMAADILRFEHFLWSGTQIIVDGRGANASFLHANLVRNWSYNYNLDLDQHEFLLVEAPWGEIVKKHLDYKKNR